MSLPSNKNYMDLACEALIALQHGSTGCSLPAIKQYIQSQYPDLDLKNVS
jgi:hypothetical protein